jgi:hypothetical protein
MCACRHRKDIIQLLKRPLFRLRHPEEDHNECNHIRACVKAENTKSTHGFQHKRQEHSKDGGPEKTCSDGPTHSNFSVGKGEDFCGVGEGNGSFTWGVEYGKDVDEEGDEAEMGFVLYGNEGT